jgi:glucosamine-6-phosphate deaminase
MVAIPLDAERVRAWLAIPVEELAERSPIPLTVLPSKEDVYRHFAQEIFQEAEAAAAAGEELTVIVPLGPRAHYALLARMVNEAGLSLEHVSYFGMDQWLDWQARPLPWEHPFNLESYFHRHFVDLLEPRLRPRPENVIFPSVHDLDRP